MGVCFCAGHQLGQGRCRCFAPSTLTYLILHPRCPCPQVKAFIVTTIDPKNDGSDLAMLPAEIGMYATVIPPHLRGFLSNAAAVQVVQGSNMFASFHNEADD